MKHSGRARGAAFKLLLISLILGFLIWALIAVISVIGTILSAVAVPVLLVLWVLFSLFTLYFFRDPTPHVPTGANLVVSPGHGKIDVIDTTTEPLVIGGECKRVSMFLSVFDVHVQNAPITGRVSFFKYSMGEFLNALKTESALHNENVLLGFESSELPGRKLAVRLIAGVIARRIVPFVQESEEVKRGERISLIQFGSRVDVFLPMDAEIKVALGDHVVGGETILAVFPQTS
ncbi:MAG TPA: phosphatidylserine decarboxylase [Verrucomicrobiae bacterium]|nr:phosphatidylserine decarboxylase [Verrucomicrobiae bacterium]